MTHHRYDMVLPYPSLSRTSIKTLFPPSLLVDTAGESGAKGACLGLGPQRNSSQWLSLGGMQLKTVSLQRERSPSPRPPKTLNRIQDHIQKPSTVSLSIQILQFLWCFISRDLWVTQGTCSSGFPAKLRDINGCDACDEWSEYVLCP